MDLDLWGTRLRVRVEVPEAAAVLRAALADHLLSEPAALGFVVQRPRSSNGLYCLIDRSGLILARARSWQDVVAVLAEHLTTFAPPPPDTIRTTMRAISRTSGTEEGTILAAFPLLHLPPVVERQLERRRQRVVDRLALDLTAEGGVSLTPVAWPELRIEEPPGHRGGRLSGTRVERVLIPTAGLPFRRHEAITLLATTVVAAAAPALVAAEQLLEIARFVPINDAMARRRALED